MFTIAFPEYNFRLKEENGKRFVFDIIRKKFVVITPEEWVRQHLLYYLTETLNYPRTYIAVEYALMLNGLKKRCDIVVFNRAHVPVFIIECKKPEIPLSQPVIDQAGRYNLKMKVPYVAISNGTDNMVAAVDFENNGFLFLNEYPDYGVLAVG
jgi:hypothetical protein